jgi:hypothetical protein
MAEVGFKNGMMLVNAMGVELGDKVVVNGVVCEVVRVEKNFGAFGDYVVFDFFCEDRNGYYVMNQKFEFDLLFSKVF